MSFRELQNTINELSRDLAVLKSELVRLLDLRSESTAKPCGPAGNEFDRDFNRQVSQAIDSVNERIDVLERDLAYARMKQTRLLNAMVA